MRYPTLLPALVSISLFGGCADRQTTTAPDTPPTLSVAAARPAITVTDFATGEELRVTGAGASQAATGGRAAVHADITNGVLIQKYSFSASSTGDFPDAKGQSETHVTGPVGTAVVHTEVDCLAIIGNEAWVSGPVTKFRLNGQDLLPNFPGIQAVFRVQDNGEGGTAIDQASLGIGVFGDQVCSFMPPLPLLPSGNGNIQVSQR